MAGGDGKQVGASFFWGVIRSAVFQTATTGALWGAINAAAGAQGLRLAPGSFGQVNALRSMAVKQRRAMQSFAGMAGDQAITSNVIAQDIDSGALDAQANYPIYKVAFEHITTDPFSGQTTTEWRTSWFYGEIPATKDALLSELDAEGADMADQYHPGFLHTGIGNVVITRV